MFLTCILCDVLTSLSTHPCTGHEAKTNRLVNAFQSFRRISLFRNLLVMKPSSVVPNTEAALSECPITEEQSDTCGLLYCFSGFCRLTHATRIKEKCGGGMGIMLRFRLSVK